MKGKKIGITLPTEIYEKIEKKSKETGMSKSAIIKLYISRSLDQNL